MDLLHMTRKQQFITVGLGLFILIVGSYIIYLIIKVFQFKGEPIIFPTSNKENAKLV